MSEEASIRDGELDQTYVGARGSRDEIHGSSWDKRRVDVLCRGYLKSNVTTILFLAQEGSRGADHALRWVKPDRVVETPRDGKGCRPGATAKVNCIFKSTACRCVVGDDAVVEGLAVFHAVLGVVLALILRV